MRVDINITEFAASPKIITHLIFSAHYMWHKIFTFVAGIAIERRNRTKNCD